MKFPYAMLRDFVQTELTATQIGDLLTMAGFELEGIEEIEGDSVLDIKVVSNRGDGLSVFGLSREVLAKDLASEPTSLYLQLAAGYDVVEQPDLVLDSSVATVESEECNRFALRSFENLDASAPSPDWMQKRLRQAGMRPISLLVDITNYVMLELGQPLHAFDRDKLSEGRIVVRHSKAGESLTTLNGESHELAGQMMICDASKPVGVPGVMGGLETEVTDGTTHVLLESANFRNTTVRKTRKQLGLNTEASYRFERSVDPEGVVRAIRRFTQLLLESVSSLRYSNVVDLYPNPESRDTIRLRVSRASMLLGMEISRSQAEEYLSRLGMEVTASGDVLSVVPPSWRPDLVREEDLVEELGRVHGYEKIPDWLPHGTTDIGGARGEYLEVDFLRESAVRAGFIQTVSHSLRDFHPLDVYSGENRIGPRVPASPEHAILRDSLWPSLCDAAQRNGGRNLHLFEIGRIFFRSEGETFENQELALLSTGDLLPTDRKGATSPQTDFFKFKGLLLGVLEQAGVRPEVIPAEQPDPRLHPTRQAWLSGEGDIFGKFGQIHPDLAEKLRLPVDTYLAEVDIESAFTFASALPTFRSISRNPAVRRDITVSIDRSVPYAAMEEAVALACGELLEKQWLLDLYSGPGLAEGQHAVTLALQFRKMGENFTDEEANRVRDLAVAALENLGATMR